jgi:hypothetical protein
MGSDGSKRLRRQGAPPRFRSVSCPRVWSGAGYGNLALLQLRCAFAIGLGQRGGQHRDRQDGWANHVTADSRVATWRYLLVSEADIDTAKGPWPALKKLAQ